MSTAEFTTEFSNTAMGNAAKKIMNFVGKAVKLRDGHPDRLKLAADMAEVISLVFEKHGLSATIILPILLSAAMEILDHLDETQHFFVTVPVWANIRSDDPQIQKHPLKDKAIAGTPALVKVKPRPKLVTKRMKVAHESQESKGNDTGRTREKSPPAYTSSQKGKGREVVPGEDEDEAIEVNWGWPTRVQKRKGSNTSSPPISGSATKPQVADSTAKQTKKTSKCPKVTSETVLLTDNAPEDIDADMSFINVMYLSFISQDISFVVRDMAPQVPNFELAAVAPNKNLNACLPKPNLVHKAEKKTHSCHQCMAEEMVVSDDDAGATLPVPATSVPPITTLSLQDGPPASMDVDDSGEGLTKELEGMTLELHDENTTATGQLKTLEARIAAQDATLLELQGLDQQLWHAEDQLGHQECTTAILQDAYNAIHQHLTEQPQPPSFPFTNTMYLANPMYGGSQSMVLVNMGQMQAMEGMYLNLPSSVGNI
ncbi:hypothetical protein EDB19DRAFT_1914530 [Suillus lakei]|nr:hypothetical protein EDB19DRAFT_1914530 [Suillus lakei]